MVLNSEKAKSPPLVGLYVQLRGGSSLWWFLSFVDIVERIVSRNKKMLKLYYHPTPNPAKVALYLEETNTPYKIIATDTRKGDQHKPEFRVINPNSKTPTLVDGDIKVFDSSAILLYLGEKIGKFMPVDTPQAHAELYSWLMFVATGIGPYCGQAIHFKHFAPKPKDYAVNRYDFEAWRHWLIIEERLSKQPYMLRQYSIVDMSVWGWARVIPIVLGEDAWEDLPSVKRLLDEINAKPSAQAVEAIKTKYTFKTDIDAESLKNLFPSDVKDSSSLRPSKR
jgi:GST-like protein